MEWKVEKAFSSELLRIAVASDDFLFCLQTRLDIVVSVSTNVYEVKFGIHQADVTISFQVFKNKLRKKDIVLRPMLRYKG